MKYKIYCDCDGVLADFDLQFKNLTGFTPADYEFRFGLDSFWEVITKEGEDFWINIPKMKDMDKLWDYISKYNPPLLTAPSREESSKRGKEKWVAKHLPGVEIIFSAAKKKKQYANENSILIDDRLSNITDWKLAGGIGIFHLSADDTILRLKSLGL